MDDKTKIGIVQELNEIILEKMPDAAMVGKYGGIIIEKEAGQPKSHCCGYFIYENHVSLEFTRGFQLHDADGILEGSGKKRRHIKLKDIADIKTKRCSDFLEQVSKL